MSVIRRLLASALLTMLGVAAAHADVEILYARLAAKRFAVPPPRWDPLNYNISSPNTFCAWWSAVDHGTFRMTDTGGGAISAWVDRINGIAMTATSMPSWSNNVLNFNGHAGSGNYMLATSYAQVPTTTNASEIWLVVRQDAGVEAAARWVYGQGTNTQGELRALVKAANPVTYTINGGVTQLIGPAVQSNDAPGISGFNGSHIIRALFNNGEIFGGIDDVSQHPPAAISFGPRALAFNTVEANRLVLGASVGSTPGNFWLGAVSDVVISCRPLTPNEGIQLYNYLANATALRVLQLGPAP